MVDQPEYEAEFYEHQIQMMINRYQEIFKNWKLSWGKYYSYVTEKLRNKTYWIWIYLCGFEKFIQEQGDEPISRKKRLYKDADERIWRIIGDFFKTQQYVNSL